MRESVHAEPYAAKRCQLASEEEAAIFRRCRVRVFTTTLEQFVRDSTLRAALVLGLTAAFWGVMYVLFQEGFLLLRAAIAHPPTLARTVHAVYNLFFLSLLMMLGVSAGILYYAALYKSPEVQLLLTLPVRARRIALEKFWETTLFACWGFLLLGSPLLVAYGVVNGAPGSYYLLLIPLLVSYAIIPSACGAIVCLLLVALAPRFRRIAVGLVAVGLVVGFIYVLWMTFGDSSQEPLTAVWLRTTLARLRIAEQRVLPSWWLSTALLELAHGGDQGMLQALGFQCVLLANAMLLPYGVGFLGEGTLRRSAGRLVHGGHLMLPWNAAILDRFLLRLLRPLSPVTRLVLMKDLRLFRRDPLQWSQFLLFFGLLAFYFIYVRRLDYGGQLIGWMTAIGFMNLAVVGLILSTFTTRFVYPLISMEGQRFWILGTAPIDRREILWSKFLFATLVTGAPCCGLVLLSDIALQLGRRTPAMLFAHQWICILLSAGLSAIAVGLGARLPNLRESSPAKIAAGFGGTLTLVLSAVYVLLVVMPPAIPAYMMYADSYLAVLPGSVGRQPAGWFAGAVAMVSCIAGGAVLVSLRIGFRAFRRLEQS